MRRWIVLTVAALVALAPNAAAAQPAPPDPVQALKKQLRAERGVDVAEVSRVTFRGGSTSRTRVKGGIQFGTDGPVASYVTFSGVPQKHGELLDDVQMIITPGQIFMGADGLELPSGKRWLGFKAPKGVEIIPLPGLVLSGQTINVLDPAVLKAVLKGSKVKSVPGGHLYQGVVTYAELYRASTSYYAMRFGKGSLGELAGRKISWRLWTDRQGLVKRLMSNEKGPFDEGADTRYSGWGQRMIITPPPADEVMDWGEFLDRPLDLSSFDLTPFRTSR
ncbi:hypothetical protein [Nonomuraea sp. SBT364]|uniref:hypothetical protein n=1 Tax=Nonomuraea sp. SBT364 TaxID=1580530 RepID=UPI00066C06B0|nr:hypothetical protein [Nonomuraea sp. SBT364]